MSIPIIDLALDGDAAWPDLEERDWDDAGTTIKIACLDGGMTSGLPSVAIRLDTPDGRIVVAQTSVAALLAIADAIRARYG